MTSAIQYDLLYSTTQQLCDAWIHTPGGGHIVNRIIRRAWKYYRQKKRRNFRAIWEIERSDCTELMKKMKARNIKVKRVDGFVFNNNFIPYVTRFVLEREPRFEWFKWALREVGESTPPRKAVVIPLKGRKYEQAC